MQKLQRLYGTCAHATLRTLYPHVPARIKVWLYVAHRARVVKRTRITG